MNSPLSVKYRSYGHEMKAAFKSRIYFHSQCVGMKGFPTFASRELDSGEIKPAVLSSRPMHSIIPGKKLLGGMGECPFCKQDLRTGGRLSMINLLLVWRGFTNDSDCHYRWTHGWRWTSGGLVDDVGKEHSIMCLFSMAPFSRLD